MSDDKLTLSVGEGTGKERVGGHGCHWPPTNQSFFYSGWVNTYLAMSPSTKHKKIVDILRPAALIFGV